MKKLLTNLVLVLSFAGIGFGIFVYSNMSAYEHLVQPSATALAEETIANYMQVEKEGLALNLKSIAEAYKNLKISSSARIDELKFSLMVLVVLLCVSACYIFILLAQLKRNQVARV